MLHGGRKEAQWGLGTKTGAAQPGSAEEIEREKNTSFASQSQSHLVAPAPEPHPQTDRGMQTQTDTGLNNMEVVRELGTALGYRDQCSPTPWTLGLRRLAAKFPTVFKLAPLGFAINRHLPPPPRDERTLFSPRRAMGSDSQQTQAAVIAVAKPQFIFQTFLSEP